MFRLIDAIRRWLKEWKQAIADVDAGGDSNESK
jgi:hypothetical protein